MGAEKTWGVLHFLLWYYQQSDVLDSWRQKALKVLCQELPELSYWRFQVVSVSTDSEGYSPFSSDLHWLRSVDVPLIHF